MAALSSSLRRPDAIAGLAVTVYGIGYAVVALGTPEDPSQNSVVGPSAFPVLFGGLLALGGLALVARGLRAARRRTGREVAPSAEAAPASPAGDQSAEEQSAAEQPAPRARRSFWVLVALLIGYVLVFQPLGYLVATAVFLMALMTYLNARRWLVNLAFSILFPVAVYLLFGLVIRVTLPTGVLTGVLP